MILGKKKHHRSLEMPAYSPEPISFEQALALFDELASNQKIAHGYLREGCHHRATLMCDLMVRSGYAPMKAWMFNSKSDLHPASAPKGDKITWWFHVAPSLRVSLAKGGKEEALVFDPSIYDGPVTIEEWCKPIITSSPKKTVVYLSEYNRCIKTQFKKDLEDISGMKWDIKVDKALKALSQYQDKQESWTVFRSKLRQSFNNVAPYPSKMSASTITTPVRKIKNSL